MAWISQTTLSAIFFDYIFEVLNPLAEHVERLCIAALDQRELDLGVKTLAVSVLDGKKV